MVLPSRRARALVAPVLLVLASLGTVGPYLGHQHEGPAFGVDAGPGTLYSAGALHPNAPAHLEAAHSIEVRACDACVLRAQSRDGDVPDIGVRSPHADRSRRAVACDPRIASPGAVGPPGSRGPPSLPVVS